MELDDLKQAWQDQKLDVSEAPDVQNIMNMLQNKNYGPIASLREKYNRSNILSIIMLIGLLFYITFQKGGWKEFLNNRNGVLYAIIPFIVFGLIIQIYQFYIIKILNQLQKIEKPIKQDVLAKLKKISNFLRLQQLIIIVIGVVCSIALEILFYYHPALDIKILSKWFGINIFLRILGYVAYIVLVVLISRYSFQRQYGKHVDYLKDLANQLQ